MYWNIGLQKSTNCLEKTAEKSNQFSVLFFGVDSWLKFVSFCSEADIPVVGNVFSFVFTKYPPDWRWRFLKVSMWLLAVGVGMVFGKTIIHGILLSRFLRLKMFRADQVICQKKPIFRTEELGKLRRWRRVTWSSLLCSFPYLVRGDQPQVTRLQRVSLPSVSEHFSWITQPIACDFGRILNLTSTACSTSLPK